MTKRRVHRGLANISSQMKIDLLAKTETTRGCVRGSALEIGRPGPLGTTPVVGQQLNHRILTIVPGFADRPKASIGEVLLSIRSGYS